MSYNQKVNLVSFFRYEWIEMNECIYVTELYYSIVASSMRKFICTGNKILRFHVMIYHWSQKNKKSAK